MPSVRERESKEWLGGGGGVGVRNSLRDKSMLRHCTEECKCGWLTSCVLVSWESLSHLEIQAFWDHPQVKVLMPERDEGKHIVKRHWQLGVLGKLWTYSRHVGLLVSPCPKKANLRVNANGIWHYGSLGPLRLDVIMLTKTRGKNIIRHKFRLAGCKVTTYQGVSEWYPPHWPLTFWDGHLNTLICLFSKVYKCWQPWTLPDREPAELKQNGDSDWQLVALL